MAEKTEWSVWHEYYESFSYMEIDDVRTLCHPKKRVHPEGSDRAVILIHGLTDSPYSMQAIGDYFYHELGYDVYLPLLQCHGLKDANGMQGVRLSAWKKNVQFSIDTALAGGHRVSIGGLSTGGALAFNFIIQDHRLTGELYLFSAAFGLYGGKKNTLSPVIEGFLKQPFVPLLKTGASLVTKNPYRYRRVPLIAARELVFLLDENTIFLKEIAAAKTCNTTVFSAWSEADRVIRIDLLEVFNSVLPGNTFASFIIPKKTDVSHASLVLAEHVYGVNASPGDPPIENGNPYFNLMMESMTTFEQSARLGQR